MPEQDTRAEHLAWCKQRAIQELEWEGGGPVEKRIANAMASMASDLGKNPKMEGSLEVQRDLGFPLLLGGHMTTIEQCREWIEGFN